MSKNNQEFRIKELLAQRQDSRGRRMNMTSLALAIDEAYGTVAGVVYGNRVNPAVRAKIANFLGLPVEELFGGNGAEAPTADTMGETERPAGGDACPTLSDEVSHG